jgi:hypothetical protein
LAGMSSEYILNIVSRFRQFPLDGLPI